MLNKIFKKEKKGTVPFFLTILSLCFIFFSLQAQDYSSREIVSVEKNLEAVKKLWTMNLDFLMEWDNRVYILASPDELSALEKENIPYELETQNFKSSVPRDLSIKGGVNGLYHTYRELERDLMNLQDVYPELARVFSLGESLEGRNIYAIKISDNVLLDEEEAEVFFVGCHHAREWISVEVPFLLAKYLLENYGTSPEVKDLVDQSEIWIVPLANPDGLEYSVYFYRYWRKNRRDNGNGSYGVDMNRNYGYNWGFDDQGSSPNPNSEVFRGTGPFSEPETQAIRDLFALKNFQATISFHNYSQVILYPWGYTEEPTDKDALLEEIAANMSALIQSVNGNVYDYGRAGSSLYLTNGDMTDWTFGTYGIPSYTVELPPIDFLQGGFFNAEEDIQSIFNENLPAMLYLVDWSIQNYGSNMPFSEGGGRRPGQRGSLYDLIQRGLKLIIAHKKASENAAFSSARENSSVSNSQPKRNLTSSSPTRAVYQNKTEDFFSRGSSFYLLYRLLSLSLLPIRI